MAFDQTKDTGQLLEHLPGIYQEEAGGFLRSFLWPFEEVLLGLPGAEDKDDAETARTLGLAEKISRLHLLFDPLETPEDFLPWLARWASVDLSLGLSLAKKRKLLAHILPLYRIRGTKQYLEELLRLCLDVNASVNDREVPPLQVGVNSTVGDTTQIGGGPPHYFSVTLMAPKLDAAQVEVQCRLARRIIELAKPAHAYYELHVISPVLQLGVHAAVGVDTILGES